jgi:HlyD family secretion protein
VFFYSTGQALRNKGRKVNVTLWKKIILVLAVLALVSGLIYLILHFKSTGETQPIVAKVERGDIQRSLSFSGSISHVNQVDVASKVTGTVSEVFVKVGDKVEKGQELIKIEIPDFDYQISQAQLNLDVARLKLQQLKEGPTEEELNVLKLSVEKAQQDLSNAEENYQRVLETTTFTTSIAENAVSVAERRLREAQDNLELTKKSVEQAVQMAQTSVDQALEDLENASNEISKAAAERKLALAKDQLEAQKIAGEQQIKAAEAQLTSAEDSLEQARQNLKQKNLSNRDLMAQAENALESAKMGLKIAQAQYEERLAQASPTALELQEKMVEQAELSLNNLLKEKEDSTVRAPTDGIVGALNVKIGDPVMNSTPLLSLVDLNLLEVQASIPEVNIGLLSPQMEATVKADAYPEHEFKATLSYFNPLASVVQGVVNYVAHFTLEKEAMNYLKPGMTVEVEIVVEKSSHTLIIPLPALHQEGSQDYVYVWDGKKMEYRQVKTGIQNEIQVEIREGLKEGEEVVLALKSSSFSFAHPTSSILSP